VSCCKNSASLNGGDDARLHNKSLQDLFADPEFCCYFGTTNRLILIEWLRWLTVRG
jgi:hypothetical protein